MFKESIPATLSKQSKQEDKNAGSAKDSFETSQKKDLQNLFSILETIEDANEREKIATDLIQQSSSEEFLSFIDAELVNSPRHFNISKSIVKKILERAFSECKLNKESEKIMLSKLKNELTIAGIFRPLEKGNQQSEIALITDKTFQAILELYWIYPEICQKFFDLIAKERYGYHITNINPYILVNGIAEIVWRPDVNEHFKNSLLSYLHNQYDLNAEHYTKAIQESLDFKNPENFYKTGTFLEFLHQFEKVALFPSPYEFNEIAQSYIKNVLKKAIENNEGSYLLHLRALDLVQEMDEQERKWEERQKMSTEEIDKMLEEESLAILKTMAEEDKKGNLATKKEDRSLYQLAPDVMAKCNGYKNVLYINRNSQNISFLSPITIEDIALTKKSGDLSEQDKELFFDFLYLSRPEVRQHIRKDLEIEFSSIPLKEQVYFLQFIKDKTEEDFEPIKQFTKKFGNLGLRAFLSLECDRKLGEKIINIGEKMDEKDARKVFAKISELVDLAEKENAELAEIISANQKDADMSGAKFELLKSARDVIVSFSDKLESDKQDPKEIEELINKLEKIRGEIILFKSIFRQIAKEHPKMSFDYFKSLELAFQKGEEVTGEDKETMIGIIEKNWSNQAERSIVLAGLEKGLHNPDTVFEILKYKEKIVSFLRFDRHYDEQGAPTNSYFGSFNTDSDFQGAAIGDVMLKECLNTEAELSTIKAHCFSTNRVTSKYIEDAGFIITGIALNYAGTDKTQFEITRDDRINEQYKYRGKFETDVKKEFETLAENFTGSAIGKPFLKVGVDQLSNTAMLEKIKIFMKKHNLVITRYFPDNKKQPKHFIMVFEKKIPEPEQSAYIV